MNPDPEKLRALLDDVLPASGEHCGPSGAEVLSMLRNERQRRRRLHSGAALLAIIAVALCLTALEQPAARRGSSRPGTGQTYARRDPPRE